MSDGGYDSTGRSQKAQAGHKREWPEQAELLLHAPSMNWLGISVVLASRTILVEQPALHLRSRLIHIFHLYRGNSAKNALSGRTERPPTGSAPEPVVDSRTAGWKV